MNRTCEEERAERHAHATRMPAQQSKPKAPRSTAGGRSGRYEKRRADSAKQYAPRWSDSTANAAWVALHELCATKCCTCEGMVEEMLSGKMAISKLTRKIGGRLSESERATVAAIMQHHKQAHEDGKLLSKAMGSCMKPLYERRATGTPTELAWEAPPITHKTLRTIIAKHPSLERLRDLQKSRRIVDGLGTWPLGWLKKPSLVCYERALGRIEYEHPDWDGVPTQAMARRLVGKMRERRGFRASRSFSY